MYFPLHLLELPHLIMNPIDPELAKLLTMVFLLGVLAMVIIVPTDVPPDDE